MDDLSLALRIRALVEGQDAIVRLGTSFFETNKQIENLTRGLVSVTGSSEEAAKTLDQLKSKADLYGLSILELAQHYVSFMSAAKGTNLEGAASERIFNAVSASMAVLGGESVKTNRAMTALSQIMSKGQIYAEELKGQLAEAIPGALQIMSKSLGITTSEMLGLMKAGQLSSEALLPFAIELEKQFGSLATESTTFSQALNRVGNTWTNLMSRLGDTGVWSGLTSGLSALANHSELLAGVVGIGLAGAFSKVIGTVGSMTTAVQNYAVAGRLQASTAQQQAVANIRAAETNLVAANAAHTNAVAIRESANATLAASIGTANELIARRELSAAIAGEIIAKKGLTAATEELTLSQTRLAASSTLWGRSLAFLTGPGGMIALMVAGFAAMAYAFREQDEATKNLSKSTDEYAQSLSELTSAQTQAAVIAARKEIDARSELIDKHTQQLDLLQQSINSENVFNNLMSLSLQNLKYYSTAEEARLDITNRLNTAQKERDVLEGKRTLSLESLLQKYTSLSEAEKNTHDRVEEANTGYREQVKIIENLNNVENKSKQEKIALATAIENQNRFSLQRNDALQKEALAVNLQKDAYNLLQKELKLSDEGMQVLMGTSKVSIDTLDAHTQAIIRNTRNLVDSAKRQEELKNQLKLLKAEQEGLQKVELTRADVLIKQAEVLGDLAAKQDAEVNKAQLRIDVDNRLLDIGNKQLLVLQEELKTAQALDNQDSASHEKNQKKIADLQAKIAVQTTSNQQTRENIKLSELEAIKIEAVRDVLNNAMADQVDSTNQAQQAVYELSAEITKLQDAGVPVALLSEKFDALRKAQELAKNSTTGLRVEQNLTIVDIERYKNNLDQARQSSVGIEKAQATYNEALRKFHEQQQFAADDLTRLNALHQREAANNQEAIKNKIALAIATGHEVDTIKLKNELIQNELQNSINLVQQRENEVNQLNVVVAALEQKLSIDGRLELSEQRQLAFAKQSIEQKQLEIERIQSLIPNLEQEAKVRDFLSKGFEQLFLLRKKDIELQRNQEQATTQITNAALNLAQAELKLAQAKGDKQDIDQAQVKVDEQNLQASYNKIDAINTEIQALTNKREEILFTALADNQYAEDERAAVAAIELRIDATQRMRDSLEGEAIANQKATEATRQKQQADLDAIAAGEQLKAVGKEVTGLLGGWSERLAALSPAANKAFTGFAESTDVASESLSQLKERYNALVEEMGGVQGNQSADAFIQWTNTVASKALAIEEAFLSQKIAVQKAIESLDDYAATGNFTTQTQQALQLETAKTRDQFNLLNDADLSRLQDSIDKAKGKMLDLKKSAQEALAAAQQALLQEQGNSAELLRLEFKQKSLELEQKIAEAKAASDFEAISNLQKALAIEKETYAIKQKKAELDNKQSTSNQGTTTVSKGGSYSLDLSFGGQRLKATSETNPEAFLKAITIAQRSAA